MCRISVKLGGFSVGLPWAKPGMSSPRRVMVPDLRGLFTRSCLRVAGDLGLHLEMVRLTGHPMPVEGLVVDQSPLLGSKVRRSSSLTVEFWEPSEPLRRLGSVRISRATKFRWDWISPVCRAFLALAPLSVVRKTHEQLRAAGQAPWQEPDVLSSGVSTQPVQASISEFMFVSWGNAVS